MSIHLQRGGCPPIVQAYNCDPPGPTTTWAIPADVDLTKVYRIGEGEEAYCIHFPDPPKCCPLPPGHTMLGELGDPIADCATCIDPPPPVPQCGRVTRCDNNGVLGYFLREDFPDFVAGAYEDDLLQMCVFVNFMDCPPEYSPFTPNNNWKGPFNNCAICTSPCCLHPPPDTVSFDVNGTILDSPENECGNGIGGAIEEGDAVVASGTIAIPGPGVGPVTVDHATGDYGFAYADSGGNPCSACDESCVIVYHHDKVKVSVSAGWSTKVVDGVTVDCLTEVELQVSTDSYQLPNGNYVGGFVIATFRWECRGEGMVLVNSQFNGTSSGTASLD